MKLSQEMMMDFRQKTQFGEQSKPAMTQKGLIPDNAILQ